MKLTRPAAILLMAMLLAGCEGNDGGSPTESGLRINANIRPMNRDGLANFLRKRRGRIVLLNIWATWCAPCIPKLKALALLSKKFRGVLFVSINLDKKERRDRVRRIQAELSGDVIGFYSSEKDPRKLLRDIDERWAAILPSAILLGRNGEVLSRYTGARAFLQIESDLRAALRDPNLNARIR